MWHALDPALRGLFYVPGQHAEHARRLGLDIEVGRPKGEDPPILVASYADLRTARPRRSILLEHGIGQRYEDGHPSNPGGADRDDVLLFLDPSERVAELNRAAYPWTPAEVVGSPKLDRWATKTTKVCDIRRTTRPADVTPTVALSFHWDNSQHDCSRWAYPHFEKALPALVERFHVIGHGHPRWERFFGRLWKKLGVEHVRDLDEVFERADVYVIDNSSSGYEAAAIGIPTVWLNCPGYEGWDLPPRFSDLVPGLQCNEPNALVATVERALCDPPDVADNRRRVVRAVYSALDGKASARAADAIARTLCGG